jgi:hypothetical protein
LAIVAVSLACQNCSRGPRPHPEIRTSDGEVPIRVDLIWLNDYPVLNFGLVDVPDDRRALEGRRIVVRGILMHDSQGKPFLVAGVRTPSEQMSTIRLEPDRWASLEGRLVEAVGRVRMAEDQYARATGVVHFNPAHFVLTVQSVNPIEGQVPAGQVQNATAPHASGYSATHARTNSRPRR